MRFSVMFLAGILSAVSFLVAGPLAGASLFGSPKALVGKPVQRGNALVQIRAAPDGTSLGSARLGAHSSGSLFADRRQTGLFAPVTRPPPISTNKLPNAAPLPAETQGIPALRDLIATVEAGRAQYDAVVYSAKVQPDKRPTEMTLAEIYKWIEDTPGQNHAIGRYQFIPDTLRYVVATLRVKETAQFSPQLQDQLAGVLLRDAGVRAFLSGDMPQKSFMNNLAKIWAGLPNSTGKSHYSGVGSNKAGMSWDHFQAEMTRIFPDRTDRKVAANTDKPAPKGHGRK